MGISSGEIKELRTKTGAGIMACKAALKEAQGNLQKALIILRKKGEKMASQKAQRETSQGLVEAYIHLEGKVGSLILVSCETDFVARTLDFKTLVHDLAMQVAATDPTYLSPEDIKEEEIEKEKQVFLEQLSGKKPAVMEKIISGKLNKFYEEVCLLKQPFIKDDKLTIEELIKQKVGKLGENIQIKKFVRFSL